MVTKIVDIQAEISKSEQRLDVLRAELSATEAHLAEVETARRLAEDAQRRLADVSGADAPAAVPDGAVTATEAEIERIQTEIRRERAVLEKLRERHAEQATAGAQDAIRAMEPVFDERDGIAARLLEATDALVTLGNELEEADQKCIKAHRLAAQACSAAGLPKPQYRRFCFGRPHATRQRLEGRRVMVELINSLNRGG
jgi:chromosome segregation ATPase